MFLINSLLQYALFIISSTNLKLNGVFGNRVACVVTPKANTKTAIMKIKNSKSLVWIKKNFKRFYLN
jgi:hypothetical protein